MGRKILNQIDELERVISNTPIKDVIGGKVKQEQDLIVLIKFNYLLSTFNALFSTWEFVDNKESNYVTIRGVKKRSRTNRYYVIKSDVILCGGKRIVNHLWQDEETGRGILNANDYKTTFSSHIAEFESNK